jgi:hypothetical protein
MNNLLTKFKDIYTATVKIPDGDEITINKLNVDFQSSLQTEIEDSNNDYTAVLKYILYVNRHICSLHRDYNFTYKDKLFLIDYWISDISSIEPEKLNLHLIDELKDSQLELQLDKSPVLINFIQPNILQENKILEFLLDQKEDESGRMHVIFFDVFRFIHSMKIGEQLFLIENLSISEFFELFKLLSVSHLRQISEKLTTMLQDVGSVRELEADITAFY